MNLILAGKDQLVQIINKKGIGLKNKCLDIRMTDTYMDTIKETIDPEPIDSIGVRYRFHAFFKKIAQLHRIGRETMKLWQC